MRIRKTSQYIEGGAGISNEYGTSQTDGYSQSYINNIQDNALLRKEITGFSNQKLSYYAFTGNANGINVTTPNHALVMIIAENPDAFGVYRSSTTALYSIIESQNSGITKSGTTLTIPSGTYSRLVIISNYDLTIEVAS